MLKWTLFSFSFLLSLLSYADKIDKLEIDVYLNADRSVNVRETYTFIPNFQIRHGLYRFLPVRYYTTANEVYGIPLTINEILLNGKLSPYHVKSQIDFEVSPKYVYNVSKGKAIGFDVIYIGDKHEYLNSGELYTTTIDYTVQNVVVLDSGMSRFSWNLQGFGWEMSRDSVTARFHFPEDASLSDVQFFVGSIRESKPLEKEHYNYDEESKVVTLFYKKLMGGQDITIDSYFPTNTFLDNSGSYEVLFFSYKTEIIIWITIVLSFLIWLITWIKVGRDPKGLIRMTRYESPDDMTPAECRYFRNEVVDKRTSVATIVQAAIKGYIQIDKKNKTTSLVLQKKESFDSAPKGVKGPFSSLFGKGDDLAIKKSTIVASRFNYFKERLKKQVIKKHPNQFRNNFGYFALGLIFALLGVIWSINTTEGDIARNIFVLIMIPSVFTAVFWFGLSMKLEETVGAQKTLLMIIGVVLGGVYIYIIPKYIYVSDFTLYGFTVIAFSGWMWRYLMKNRTAFSREMEDKVMGYEHYLKSTEERYLDFLNKPNEAPILFEKHLPYAIALDCELKWSKAFEKAILEMPDVEYQPNWFYSSLGYTWLTHNLYSNVSTNSVAPASTGGSSSYSGGGFSGGGGSSGGGFGGGGGGGW